MAQRALLYTGANVVFVLALLATGIVAPGLMLPYALQLAETVWGALRPAVGVRPTLIGVRQLIVSTLFTLLLILTWR